MAKKKKKAPPKQRKPTDVWTRCCEIKLRRKDLRTGKLALLEPGVNFFILMLEQLGCKTSFSCEGHPHGFYIQFSGPLAVACGLVNACKVFRVEVDDQVNVFTIRLWSDIGDNLTDSRKEKLLRLAAANWQRKFGRLDIKAASVDRKKRK